MGYQTLFWVSIPVLVNELFGPYRFEGDRVGPVLVSIPVLVNELFGPNGRTAADVRSGVSIPVLVNELFGLVEWTLLLANCTWNVEGSQFLFW